MSIKERWFYKPNFDDPEHCDNGQVVDELADGYFEVQLYNEKVPSAIRIYHVSAMTEWIFLSSFAELQAKLEAWPKIMKMRDDLECEIAEVSAVADAYE